MPSRQRGRRQRGYPTASEVRGGRTSEPSTIPCMEQDRINTFLLSSLGASVESAQLAEEMWERERTFVSHHQTSRGYAELSERSIPAASARTTTTTPIRPIRSAPRAPVCHFFALNGSCRNGDHCAFSHNVTPGDTRSVPCQFFQRGNCRYGDSCRFRHAITADGEDEEPTTAAVCQPCNDPTNDSSTATAAQDDDDDGLICGICMEAPSKFGLLSGCDHVFCFKCLMEWRSSGNGEEDEQQKSMVKVCPICRTHSDYVLSSYTYAKTEDGKEDLMAAHKLRLSQIPCKRFNGDLGSCPFGRDCFYQHMDEYANDVKHLDLGMQEIQEILQERRERRQQQRLRHEMSMDAELEILEAQLALLQLGLASFSFHMDI